MSDDRVACRTPAEGRDGVTNIPAWKFDLIRGHIVDILSDGTPQVYNDVRDAVGTRLSADEAGAPGKLELEVRGEIERVKASGPQQIRWVT
ncbi:hypothetical protein [uncultured Roseobacter sp.]|uniref:DUF6958 family protein n=1 Tax=uncultured Roseobacter sp. TaxID=114847 RepID=UPI002639AEEC|nr:hypothetical protein [uncultured Roseobacter sp.]